MTKAEAIAAMAARPTRSVRAEILKVIAQFPLGATEQQVAKLIDCASFAEVQDFMHAMGRTGELSWEKLPNGKFSFWTPATTK